MKLGAVLALTTAAACAHADAPREVACPANVEATTRCLAGKDEAGAFYLIAQPKDWNGVLVLHAHGGPILGAPTPERVAEDLQRWAITPRLGYAWAGTSYAQGGVAVTSAAQDVERLRKLFIAQVAKPRLTLLHGQSWGAGVAARAAEMFDAAKPYDGVLLTSGVLGGGVRSYDFRLDLRVVYEYLCNNHPRPDEPSYALGTGLPPGQTMPNAEITRRANACLGLDKPAEARSAEEARRIKTIVDVVHIPERSIVSHLSWATLHFQDIARRSDGHSPFGNRGVVYRGSDDDEALNAKVRREVADPAAAARFAADAGLTGHIPVPVLNVHAIHDPTAFVELESVFADTMAAGGHAGNLVQVFTEDREHSYLSDPTYAAAFAALQAWVEKGAKPVDTALVAACEQARERFAGSTCRIKPGYRPAPLQSRNAAR